VPIQTPELHWPTELVEAGPQDDPSRLLGGTTSLSGVQHHVYAPRVQLITSRPILGPISINPSTQTTRGDVARSSIVELEGGRYIIWTVPSGSSPGP
jgi:hypothetical protein